MQNPTSNPEYGVATVKTGVDITERFYCVSGFRRVMETVSESRRTPIPRRMTRTGAEYVAVADGLSAALDLGFDEVSVVTTSEEVVEHVQGNRRCTDKRLQPLVQDIERLQTQLSTFRIECAPD